VTVLTSESTLLGTTGRLPRVNLLPPEIAEAKKAKRIQGALGVAGLASLALVGGLYLMANQSLSSAQTDLASAQEQKGQLQSQKAQYAGVTATIAAANAAQAQLVTAMADEVRYSQLLNDLSLAVPSTVWLKSLAYAPAAAAPGAMPATPAVAGAVAAPTQVGTLTVSGVGFQHDDVALWLEALSKLTKTYANPYFTNSTEALIGSRPTVNFQANAVVLSTARSGRYTTPAGG
jgi:Tfp pilus assembly protein PilN